MKTANNLLNLKEKKQHGNLIFPVTTCRETLGDDRQIAMHWHEEMEIAYISSGVAVFYIGANQIRASQGDIVVIEPYTLHMIRKDSSEDYTGEAIVFNLSFLEGSSDDCVDQKYIQPAIKQDLSLSQHISRGTVEQTKIVGIFQDILALYHQKSPLFEVYIKGKLFELMAQVLQCSKQFGLKTDKNSKRKNMDSIKAILSYLKKNYNEDLSLATVAKRFNYSTNYFSRLFKEQTGKTFLEYVNEYRIQRASEMLIFSDDMITDIAMEVGFNNLSYFIRQFKRFHGCSPVQFRKQLKIVRKKTS